MTEKRRKWFLRVCSFMMIWIRISDPRLLGTWCMKIIDESATRVIHPSFDLPWSEWSWITDPEPDYPKGSPGHCSYRPLLNRKWHYRVDIQRGFFPTRGNWFKEKWPQSTAIIGRENAILRLLAISDCRMTGISNSTSESLMSTRT